jgi:hypothetical protein
MRAVHAAVAAGLLLRLAFGLGYWTGKPLTHDEREYLTLAANIAHGPRLQPELRSAVAGAAADGAAWRRRPCRPRRPATLGASPSQRFDRGPAIRSSSRR